MFTYPVYDHALNKCLFISIMFTLIETTIFEIFLTLCVVIKLITQQKMSHMTSNAKIKNVGIC